MPTVSKRRTTKLRAASLGCVCTVVRSASIAAAQTPSPALLVLNKKDSSLVVIDPSSGSVGSRMSTGDTPHEMTVSSDGKLAFVANYGGHTPGNSISVIDLSTQKEFHRVDLGPLRRLHDLAFMDGKLYLTAEANKVIARYDPSTNRVDWLLGIGQNGTHMLLFRGRDTIFTANVDSDTISAVQRDHKQNDWRETVIPVGKGPEGMDLSPDTKELWVANSGDGSVSIINVETLKVTQSFDVQTKRSNRLKFSPDGRWVLVSDYRAGDLLILDAKTHREATRIKLGFAGRSPNRARQLVRECRRYGRKQRGDG